MTEKITDFFDFERIDVLLEGFNKSTGFVTALLDLEGNVLSKSGWRQICTQFHRVNPETAQRCTISDTVLAGKLTDGVGYHHYKCLNGLVDVAAPIMINGEHIANLFSGQFFFEEPDLKAFKKQAEEYNFDEKTYMEALVKVPVVSEEKVKMVMEFLVNMTHLISEITLQNFEQTKLNTALKKSEERFRALINQAGDAMYLSDFDGNILYVNDQATQAVGYDREELLKMNVADLDPDYVDSEKHTDLWNQLLPGVPQTLLTTHKRKNATLFPVEIRLGHFEFEGKKAVLGFARDVTQQHVANEALQRSHARLKSLFENPQDIIMFSLDTSFNYVVFNEKHKQEMKKVYGVEIVEGLNMLEMISIPEIRSLVKKNFERVLNGENFEEIQVQPGMNIVYQFYWNPVKTGNGELIGISCLIIDITKIKSAEAELQEHKNNLEEIVAERTVELENKNKELDNALKVFVGRELTIRNLQNKIKALEG